MIIFFAPRFDRATQYSFDWCREVEDYAEAKGETIYMLHEREAVKRELETILVTHPRALFVFFDHGNEDCLWGNDDRHAVDLTNNSLLKKRECYTMACLSSKILGADSYRRYATIYWGSYELISFTTDALAEFKKAMNFGIKMRIDGETDWNKILDETIEHDNQVIDELLAKGKIFAAALLLEDSNARRVWTDKTPPAPGNSTCSWRRLGLRLFGQKAWRIPSPTASKHTMIEPPRL